MATENGQPAQPIRAQTLARELSGNLPCVSCAYNLRGLSVRGLCPECGLAIRATLLSVVDPKAMELQPIRCPGMVYAGLVLWVLCSLGAVSCTWAIRLTEYVAASTNAPRPPLETLSWCVAGGWIGAAASVLLLLRPHARLSKWATPGVVLASLGFVLLAIINFQILRQLDPASATLWVAGYAPQLARTGLRIAGDATLILIIAGLSQLWSSLQSRSALMRSGRMDRQSAASMYAAAGIAMVGDCIWLVFSPPTGASIDGSLLRLICQALVAVGSMLLTVGLMAILMDVVRLRRVILAMPLSLDQVTQAEGAVDAVPAKPLESRVGGVGGVGGEA